MKLCVFCKHCYFSEGYHYSEYTNADGEISCNQNKVSHRAGQDSQKDFLTWNAFAEKCPSYELPKEEE